ncbi:esterase family protein [Nocardia yunnanensis]|uniref:Esterase family protein n=1 Tax=Nocardia yunnanensis TaxID=2382165 RepID=A0A386ZDZ0_9NOCA|nr:alpha/beta hydrolase family protein [Nocardia yunnanensis]AYF74699.1 esterase family protein [Nocardia yunnanensis]
MRTRKSPARSVIAGLACALALSAPATLTTAAAAPTESPAANAAGAHLVSIDRPGQRQEEFEVYSAAMDRVIPVQVLTAFDNSVPRPTLYLLNGAGGGEDAATWYRQTDVVQFFSDKNVNVVSPVGGKFSYYTDWQQDDPVLGRQKWETFLTAELPPIIDKALGTSGANAIAGVSMSATSALNLAVLAPDLYRAVAAYSGCASTADDNSRKYIQMVLDRGDADSRNMWGPPGDPDWVRHDAVINAEALRGKALFISNSTGLPGPLDTLEAPSIAGRPASLANQLVLGGIIEAATNGCTHRLADRLGALGIPAQVEFRPAGTHSWPYWQDALHRSWPLLEAALQG